MAKTKTPEQHYNVLQKMTKGEIQQIGATKWYRKHALKLIIYCLAVFGGGMYVAESNNITQWIFFGIALVSAVVISIGCLRASKKFFDKLTGINDQDHIIDLRDIEK